MKGKSLLCYTVTRNILYIKKKEKYSMSDKAMFNFIFLLILINSNIYSHHKLLI